MVMPERLPTPLPAAPEGPGSTASAARVVAAAKVVSAEFTAVPKWRSFSAKYRLQILAGHLHLTLAQCLHRHQDGHNF